MESVDIILAGIKPGWIQVISFIVLSMSASFQSI
jgi:hypothetical protein